MCQTCCKDEQFMNIAVTVAAMSKCRKNKVGAIIVDHNNRIVSTGYNGSPKGTNNACEDSDNITFLTTLHAELNAIIVAKQDLTGCKIYVTLSPCIRCAAIILQAGITEVNYAVPYRETEGIDYLTYHGVKVNHIDINLNHNKLKNV